MQEHTGYLPGLSPIVGKQIHAAFDSGMLSSNAGVLLLREVARRLGIADRLAAMVDLFCDSWKQVPGASSSTSTTPKMRCTFASSWRSSMRIMIPTASYHPHLRGDERQSGRRHPAAGQDAERHGSTHHPQARHPAHPPELAQGRDPDARRQPLRPPGSARLVRGQRHRLRLRAVGQRGAEGNGRAGCPEKIAGLEKTLRTEAALGETTARLQTMPGIGPIGAVAIESFAPPMHSFRLGRDFTARLGLVPRQKSTGGKQILGKTSKMGQPRHPQAAHHRRHGRGPLGGPQRRVLAGC
jgi:hypothetical protein